ncbi:MAG: non-canonical purine NTP pyrophosphatase, partial [Bacteroidota bacterium]|nr:non-canonical purine NTP pyrophosphatase [Bacteroidota bacterium]
MKICLATNNEHKVAEIKSILKDSIEIINLKSINCLEELPETQNTLEGNSLQKAGYIFRNYNMNALADDTGLEVFSLDGAPGVFSAMYAGNHRNNEDYMYLLIKNLLEKYNRKFQFITIITLIFEGFFIKFLCVVR